MNTLTLEHLKEELNKALIEESSFYIIGEWTITKTDGTYDLWHSSQKDFSDPDPIISTYHIKALHLFITNITYTI